MGVLDFLWDPPERNPGKPLKWIVIDSLIIAGISFVSTLPSDHIPRIDELYIALKAFIYSLLIQLAVERGIKPYRESRKGDDEDADTR
jgi:hypothetical protein